MTKNILLCYFSIGGTSYYDDFAEELFANGNNVLCWNFHRVDYPKYKNSIIEKVKEFKTDLIFSYNNVCPQEVIKTLQAPVLILDADNPEFFHNKEFLNSEDYFYLGYQSSSKEIYKKILNIEITDKNYLFFPTATNFHKDPSIPAEINISFIGSNFYRNFLEDRIINEQERNTMLFLSKEIKKDYYFQDPNIDISLINFTKYYLAGQERLKYLSAVSDLGLQIYSNSDWRDLYTHSFDLANCYNEKVIITKKENQDLYNASKIAINLSHLQAITSFSWRVPDIMASNACLLMEDKKDWHTIFGEYISDSVKKSIIYQDQYDLREKSIRLLRDEDLRLRCVEECQTAIDKNGRWSSRLKILEEFLNIKLLNNNYKTEFSENKVFIKVLDSKECHNDSLIKDEESNSQHENVENSFFVLNQDSNNMFEKVQFLERYFKGRKRKPNQILGWQLDV